MPTEQPAPPPLRPNGLTCGELDRMEMASECGDGESEVLSVPTGAPRNLHAHNHNRHIPQYHMSQKHMLQKQGTRLQPLQPLCL